MLGAGMPIVRCLSALEKQLQSQGLKQVVTHIRKRIENGDPLSSALAEFPDVFDTLYVSMVKCGERDGRLPETISRLADFHPSAQAVGVSASGCKRSGPHTLKTVVTSGCKPLRRALREMLRRRHPGDKPVGSHPGDPDCCPFCECN